MSDEPPPALLLHRIDHTHNMARYYALSVEMTLFGGSSLVRHWGRMGTRGQCKIDLFEDMAAAAHAMHRLATLKGKRGYLPPN